MTDPARQRGDAEMLRKPLWPKLLAYVAGLGVLLVLGWYLSGHAHAADPWASADPARKQWFQNLSVPTESGDKMFCCGDADGIRLSLDQTQQRGEEWYVDLGNGWMHIPSQSIVRDQTSIDGAGYLFLKYDGHSVRCFVKPVPGY